MQSVQFSQFRQHAKEYLDAVEEGEVVYITRHGHVVAKVTPVSAPDQPAWKKKGLRLRTKTTLSDAIIEERGE